MTTPVRRTTPGGEEPVISMTAYQRYVNQAEHWPHLEDGAITPVMIGDLHPARATNALHKLLRWFEHLFDDSTEAIHEQARATWPASPRVGALIEQALGPFYAGTYLSTTAAVPHLDDIVAEQSRAQMTPGVERELDDLLFEVSIDIVATVETMAGQSLGRRASTVNRMIKEAFT